MLQDPPTKGDPSFGMFASHGKDWVAWQELWLQGLRRLHGREVFVISGEAYEEFSTGYHFKRKFLERKTEEESIQCSFDPTYGLPQGECALSILDCE